MRAKKKPQNQLSFLAPTLKEQLNYRHPLYQLAHQIDWEFFEKEFEGLYSKRGRPAHPIRLMTSLLILKSIYNLSDEKLVEEQWEMNSYFQYFSGLTHTQWGPPCAASDLVYFRKRLGKEGVEKIFKHSIDLHGKDGHDPNVSVDTTVQEKNISYPTDSKLCKGIIDKCVAIAKLETISLRRSYRRTAKKLLRASNAGNHPKRFRKAQSARKKLKTIAARLVRELERKLPKGTAEKKLELFKKVLNQKPKDKNKIYSLHEPDVYCISKGKAHKKYEFGCKASLALTQKTGIIVGAMTFKNNVFDGHTLPDVIEQIVSLTQKNPKTLTVDRGYRGKQKIGQTQILRPKPPLKSDSAYQRRKKRNHFRRRAAIEPVIGHVKYQHRAARNYLKGVIGDQINFIMAAAGFNFKKLMRKLKIKTLFPIFQLRKYLQLLAQFIDSYKYRRAMSVNTNF